MTPIFPSLQFPGMTILTVDKIAKKLGYSCEHIIGLLEEGVLVGIDGSTKPMSRMSYRIPIDAYNQFIRQRMTAPWVETPFTKLSLEDLLTMRSELDAAIELKRETEKKQPDLFEGV